jgi:hypothetical protein
MEEDVLLALANLGYWQPVAAKPWRPWPRMAGGIRDDAGSGGLSQIPHEAQIRRLTTAAIQPEAYGKLRCRARFDLLLGDLIGREYLLRC